MNKDLSKKMKVERSADTFYNVIDEFAQKKQKGELIYKWILITLYLLILLFSLVTNSSHHHHQGITGGGDMNSNGEAYEIWSVSRRVFLSHWILVHITFLHSRGGK